MVTYCLDCNRYLRVPFIILLIKIKRQLDTYCEYHPDNI